METRAQREACDLFQRLRERVEYESQRAKARRQLENLRNHALRDAYEQTDATAHLTDVEEL